VQQLPFFVPEDLVVDIIRERHGVPMGGGSGPAEQRAIAIGRAELGLE
jgi:hypothetical protein